MQQGNEARHIATNTFVLGLSKLVERGSTTLLALLVARMLGAAGLGVYTAAMAYYALVYIAAAMGGTNYVIREVAKRPSQTANYVVHLSAMVVVTSAAATAAGMLIVPHLRYSADMRGSVYLVLIGIIPGAVSSILEGVFVAHQRVYFITYTTLITAAINAGVTILLLLRGHGVISLVAAAVVVQTVETVCYFIFISRYICPLRCRFSLRESWRLLHEVKAFAGSSLLSGFVARPEIIVLSLLHNDVQLGVYSAAAKLVDVWGILPQIYMMNVFPVLSRTADDLDGKFALVRDKSIKYLLAVSLPITAGVFAAAPAIIRVLYGPGFLPAGPVLRVLVWTIPLTSLFAVTWRVLAARGEQGRVVGVQAASSLVRIGSAYPLIYLLSALGAAVNARCSALLQNVALLYYVQRRGGRIPLLRLTWRLLAAAGCAGMAAMVVLRWIPLWQAAVIGAFAYLVSLLALRAFSQDDVDLFRKALQPHITAQATQHSRSI